MSMINTCRICGEQDQHPTWRVREMMYGTREEFTYFQCRSCGCLQIMRIPDELGRFYPDDYYSYRKKNHFAGSGWRRLRYAGAIQGSMLGRLAARWFRPAKHLAWIRATGIGSQARILDVGCGHGKYLLKMHLGGYPNSVGLDPFIPDTIRYPNGLTIHKQSLEEFREGTSERFDLIMFHHSLEHMPNPLSTLGTATELLKEQGQLLIRVPVADSYAWEHYRETWVQIDAPRHLYLLTRRSIELLARRVGLEVTQVDYDSTKLQLVCSELYQHDIPGNATKQQKDIFSRAELRGFKRKVKELNQSQQGDQAVYYLSKRVESNS